MSTTVVNFYFWLDLNYEECEQVYLGHVKSIQVTADNGKSIRLSATKFRPFITRIGIRGRFKLQLTKKNKFIKLEKIS